MCRCGRNAAAFEDNKKIKEKSKEGGVDSKVELLIIGALAGLVLGALIAGFLCYKMGYNKRKTIAEAAIGSAEEESKRIINDI